jgi:tetratricopeptide (TPR) repeat protein
VIVPDLLRPDLLRPDLLAKRDGSRREFPALAFIGAAILAAGVAYRAYDIFTDHLYHRENTMATFGLGVARWPTDRAAHFIEDHHLPRELYADYVIGGYLTWRMSPRYPVYIDGRALPYGSELFFEQMRLSIDGPDDLDWQQAMQTWKIRSVLILLERFIGYRGASLNKFCKSERVKLIYLDETAAVFALASETDLPAIDCKTVKLTPPPASAPEAERYHFWTNAGSIYYQMRRADDSDYAYNQALKIYAEDPVLLQGIGQVRIAQGRWEEGEAAFRRSIKLRPGTVNWQGLGDMLVKHHRPLEAMDAYRQSIARESVGFKEWASLGEAALAAGRPQQALEAAEHALAESPWRGPAAELGRGAQGRAMLVKGTALLALFHVQEAVAALEEAMKLAPGDPSVQGPLHAGLADAYKQMGRLDDARKAYEEAKRLGTDEGPYAPTMRRLEWQLGVM